MIDLKEIDYNVPRYEDSILIDVKKWISQTPIEICRLSGREIPTYITKVLKTNIKKEAFIGSVSEGDTILLTRIVSDIAPYRSFSFENDNDNRYFVSPIMQVVGKFKDGKVSFNNLELLFDKYLMKTTHVKNGSLIVPDDSSTIGEIVKVGTNSFDGLWHSRDLKCEVGDVVMLKDNVSTEIILDGEIYLAFDESAIVCKFTEEMTLEKATFINDSVLLSSFMSKKVLNSNLLEVPDMVYEDADFTELFNRDLFKVEFVDEALKELKKGDIVLADRNLTNYAYYDSVKYFLINGIKYIDAKIEE